MYAHIQMRERERESRGGKNLSSTLLVLGGLQIKLTKGGSVTEKTDFYSCKYVHGGSQKYVTQRGG